MGDFKRNKRRSGGNFNNRSGGGNRFGGRNGRRDDRRPTMYPAVCGECGNDCEVPFRPTGERPVLCSDCFRKQGGGRDSGQYRSNNNRHGRNNFENRQQNSNTENEYKNMMEQISLLNQKLDSLIENLEPKTKRATKEDKPSKTVVEKKGKTQKKETKKSTTKKSATKKSKETKVKKPKTTKTKK